MSTTDAKTRHLTVLRAVLLVIAGSVLIQPWIPCFGQLVYQQIQSLPAGDIPGSTSPDPSMGEFPRGQLIEGSDGKLYGTMSGPGFLGGSVFRVNKDGSGFV